MIITMYPVAFLVLMNPEQIFRGIQYGLFPVGVQYIEIFFGLRKRKQTAKTEAKDKQGFHGSNLIHFTDVAEGQFSGNLY
jgi:hypothetical protein